MQPSKPMNTVQHSRNHLKEVLIIDFFFIFRRQKVTEIKNCTIPVIF